jgi:membrane protein
MTLLKRILRCIYKAAYDTVMHDGIEHAGYLAFLGLLALFPLLVFMIAIIGFLGQGDAGAEAIMAILPVFPDHITAAIKPRIVEIISGPPQGLLTVAIVGAIWTASSAVEGLRTVLNRAYRVTTPPAYWLRRSLSILQLLFLTFIMIFAMLLLVAVPLFLQNLETALSTSFITSYHEEISAIAVKASIIVLFIAVSYLYYLIPNTRNRFLDVAPGAMVVVMLWLGAAHLFTLYLSHFDLVNLIYGSLGGIIAALLFFYLCNIIFIFGAELNHQLMQIMGRPSRQNNNGSGKI